MLKRYDAETLRCLNVTMPKRWKILLLNMQKLYVEKAETWRDSEARN